MALQYHKHLIATHWHDKQRKRFVEALVNEFAVGFKEEGDQIFFVSVLSQYDDPDRDVFDVARYKSFARGLEYGYQMCYVSAGDIYLEAAMNSGKKE